MLLESNEVKSPYYCEIEGLQRCLADVGVENISSIVTDRHRQVVKDLREKAKIYGFTHCFDIWHVAKCRLLL